MRTLRNLPPWFLICLMLGLAGFATGVGLIAHSLHARHAAVALTPTGDLPASAPDVLVPEPGPAYVPPAASTRPRAPRPRPAPSSAATSRSASPSPSPSTSPSLSMSPSPASPAPEPDTGGKPKP